MEQISTEYNIDQLFNDFGLEEKKTQPKIELLNRNIYECPYCSKQGLSVFNGILYCSFCKTEFGGLIDDGAEWRNYGNDDNHGSDPTRCGNSSNPLLIESSYGTTLSYSRNSYFSRLKQLNGWQSMPYHERSLKQVFDKLTQDGFNSGLTLNIVDFSHQLYAKVIERQAKFGDTKLSRGDNRDGLISSCLFYSCKEYGVPRSPQEIAQMCDMDSSDVTRGLNLFSELMSDCDLINISKHITNYSDFIDRYCNNLDIPKNMVEEIKKFAKKVDDKKILTKNTPQAMACGCIYFMAVMHGMAISKTMVHDRCKISVPTITKSYDKLIQHTYELI